MASSRPRPGNTSYLTTCPMPTIQAAVWLAPAVRRWWSRCPRLPPWKNRTDALAVESFCSMVTSHGGGGAEDAPPAGGRHLATARPRSRPGWLPAMQWRRTLCWHCGPLRRSAHCGGTRGQFCHLDGGRVPAERTGWHPARGRRAWPFSAERGGPGTRAATGSDAGNPGCARHRAAARAGGKTGQTGSPGALV